MASASRTERLRAARLYLVCDAGVAPSFLDAALGGGVDVVQLRDKALADDGLIAGAARFRHACDAHDALLILNDRPDLVGACAADGVHVGQDDAPVAQARSLVGADAIVGLSTHTAAEVDAAHGVDYIGVGPVHATPTKPGRPAVGVELVRHASAHARVPFFAIGGIDPGNVADVVAAGAPRIAVVRALTEASDPSATAGALRAAVAREAGVGAA